MGFFDFLKGSDEASTAAFRADDGRQASVVYEVRGGVVSPRMPWYFEGRSVRAHDFQPGAAPSPAPYATQPSPSSGGLGGQQDIGRFGSMSRTLPSSGPVPANLQITEEYNPAQQEHAKDAQLLDRDSYPMYWRDQRYAAYQDTPTDQEFDGQHNITDAMFMSGEGRPPTRIARLNKRYLSAWQGVQQHGFNQTNQRLNMRPGQGQLAMHATRGPRSVSGVRDVLVQGSGTVRVPAVFVPTSVY